MGHYIKAFNKGNHEVACAIYNMSNSNVDLLYEAFNSLDAHYGISGCGDDKIFTIEQVENAKRFFGDLRDGEFAGSSVRYEKKKIRDFINNCLESARDEGFVRIGFYQR